MSVASGGRQKHTNILRRAADAWTALTTLRRARSYGHCMAAHGGALYVMRNGPGDDFLRCVMERYDLAAGQWSALPGVYVNSKGALFTARVRGDSAFTVKHQLTLVYRVTEEGRWAPRRQMGGFPESGSLLTGRWVNSVSKCRRSVGPLCGG